MSRLLRLLRNPWRPIQRRLEYRQQESKYRTSEGYQSENYWRDRHAKFGLSKKGVGIAERSEEENESRYKESGNIFTEYCRTHDIQWQGKDVLEIGCGGGFYTRHVKEAQVQSYLGIDITDQLFPHLVQEFPSFSFKKMDITKEPPPATYDLIIMIDVTQHIVEDALFEKAMGHVRDALRPGGVFLVTSWLTPQREQDYFYHVKRPLSAYKRCFPADYEFLDPQTFNLKYIFAIRGA